MNFQEAITSGFKNFAKFDGKATRPEFWYFFLFCVVGNLLLNAVSAGLASLFGLITLIPSLSVGARRLHDVGRSGWWQLISLTVIGFFVLIYWWAQPAKTQDNAF